MVSGTEILKIQTAEKLFCDVPVVDDEKLMIANIKKAYRKMMTAWHPDKCDHPDASAISAHISKLADIALERVQYGLWMTNEQKISLKVTNDTSITLKYKECVPFDLGQTYIASSTSICLCDSANADLASNAVKWASALKYANTDMEAEFKKYMPTLSRRDVQGDGSVAIIVRRAPNSLFVPTIVKSIGNIPHVHVAWMMSRMYNIACLFQYNGLMFGGFNPSSLYIDAPNHWVIPTSYWYITKLGEKLTALNSQILSSTPPSMLADKKASTKLDLHSIKLTGRILLGDVTGIRLESFGVPKAFANWLTTPAGDDAYHEFDLWMKTLEKSYGPRKFVKFDISLDTLYGVK